MSAVSGSGNAVVDAIIGRWSDAFARLDTDAIAALYSEHAMFYGSVPTLFRGRAGVADYFNNLPPMPSRSVAFADLVVEPIGDDILNMAGRATFLRGAEMPPLDVKITWIIVREQQARPEAGGWHIISHHVSPVAPLIKPA